MPEGSGLAVIRYDLALAAVVTNVISNTQFVAPSLSVFDTNQFVGYSVWVLSKANRTTTPPKGEYPVAITAFDGYGTGAPGRITHAPFTAPLTAGDTVLLLHPAIANSVIPVQVNEISGSLSANWQTAETDLVTIGSLGTINKLHSLIIFIGNLTGNIAIRLYIIVNGVERQIFPVPSNDTFSVTALPPDPPAIPVINATMAIFGTLRVTIQSDQAADNGAAIDYDYIIEGV